MEHNPSESLEIDFRFFSTKLFDNVLWINFQKNLLIQSSNLENRDALVAYLDKIGEHDFVKTIVICSSLEASGHQAYMNFFQAIKSKQSDVNLERLCEVYASLIYKISTLHKVVVHAACGDVIPLFLNLSLACDYRIAADNTVYKNSYLDMGVLPIGGGPYFLSKLVGQGKTWELVALKREYTADEALAYGAIDRIVPMAGFQAEVLKIAHQFGETPGNTLKGLKRLVQFSSRDLKEYLAFENKEFFNMVHHHSFQQPVDPKNWIML